MESSQGNSCSVIQYYKGTDTETKNANVKISNSFDSQNSVDEDLKEILTKNNEVTKETNPIANHNDKKGETSIENVSRRLKDDWGVDEPEDKPKLKFDADEIKSDVGKSESITGEMGVKIETDVEEVKLGILPEAVKKKNEVVEDGEAEPTKPEPKITKEEEESLDNEESDNQSFKRGKKRKLSEANADNESLDASNTAVENTEAIEEAMESDFEDEEEIDNKPRRRGRCKKNPDIIPSHLSSDIVLGYKILLKFLETPQFSGFHKPFKKNVDEADESKVTCFNQIKKKFDENSYTKICEFVNDVREMLVNIYESRNTVAIKKALRLEQILEQRIAQLPNYLRPQCALVLSPEEVNNSHNKIRITKGGGFVSLLLEKTEKKRYEKNREKRKMLAEERKQLKEEQDKDVQEWEKNVLLKDFEEELKSMWELPAIGHFIHLCTDILNIGEVAQFEVERMLLMPQCSDTLDLIMTALLTNSLVRAKLDRTPSMPYSIWGPLVRTRVLSWYRTWHKEGRNEQKLFEEIGVEPDFWQILGPDINPLDYYYFHELSLFQRVWILKTLCDVDFVRKKTVHDNIRAQTLDELSPDHLGMDQQGNRYILFKQFSGSDIRIYRQSSQLDEDISPSELIESAEGFEHREGPITADKVFRDIWELNEKPEVKTKKKKVVKTKRARSFSKVTPEPAEKKNLRRSVRAKQKTYADWSDSDQSDTDLITLKNKLTRADSETLYRPFSDKEFISLSVFRLPRDKVNKPSSKRSSYVCRKAEDSSRSETSSGDKNVKTEVEERKEEAKRAGCEDEQSDSLDAKQMQDIQADFKKIFQGDDMNGDEFNLGEKISNCKLDKVNNDVKFSVKNLENLKMVFSKGNLGEESSEEVPPDVGTCEKDKPEESSSTREKEYDALYKYNVPDHLKPDNNKFYLVVDSVEGLRQLISKFGSHENDLEIITRSTKSKKKNSHSSTSSEVQLIERLQNLLLELEPWEFDLMKSCRSNKEKMYKEYMNFINRPTDFVHPNEAYWMKTYEEPAPSTASATATTTTTTTTTADGSATNGEKTGDKENGANETTESNQQDNSIDGLIPRKRTRVTRLQLQPDNNDLDEDFDDGDDYESNESDDNWVLPTPKRKAKKEPSPKTPKLPRRSGGRRSKSSPFNKTDSQTNTGEKSQNSSSEKTKKALFWGPRSSDPSEDLNWEKNRQKILEQHNSPVKKVVFKSDEIINDMAELENAMQHPYKTESPSTSVITTPPKRYTPQIPGNKKPYFSSAQLKALESQGKKGEAEESFLGKNSSAPRIISPKPEVKSTASNTGSEISVIENKAPVKIQTYSRIKKTATNQQGMVSPQTLSASGQPLVKIAPSTKIDVTNSNSQHLLKFAHQLNKQIQNSMAPVQVTNQTIQNVVASGGGLEQKPVQTQHVGRVQQIQVQQPSGQLGQSRTIPGSVAGVRMQQPVQWQPKVIAVQQPVQTQAQVQIQGQPQVQLSNQSQVQMQGQVQQVIRLEPQKIGGTQQPVQVAAEKLATVQQMVISQAQQSPGIPNLDNDLYITDGKLLIKFDQNFIQQYLQKDKVLTLNVNEKLDLKKPLLIVKPKADSSSSSNQSQAQPSTSQQNILVINKPTNVQQQTVVSSSVPNFVIPGNYIIKEANQIQPQGEQQTVKIVQQTPAYVIQQKPAGNKGAQSQIFKIITSQPMAGNQNLILSPANINVANQIIQPVTQTVMGDQQTKSPTTLRFMRPQTTTSTAANLTQSKVNPVQNQIIVNNLVPIPSQRLDASKSQGAIVAGRIVSTGVPTIRMATPVQTPTVVTSTQGTSQVVNPGTGVQLMKVATSAQNQQIQNQVVLASGTSSSQLVRSAGHLGTQLGKSGVQPQQVQNQTLVVSANSNPQFVTSMANLNPPTLKIATGAQTQQVHTQTTASSAGVNSQVVLSTAALGAQPVRLATTVQAQAPQPSANPQLLKSTTTLPTQSVKMTTSAQPQLVQTQTVLVSANPNSHIVGSSAQPVRILTGGQPQQVQAQVLVPSGSLNPQTVRMATNANGQPVRLMSSGQPQPVRFVANNSVGVRFINRNVIPVKATVITSAPQPSVVAVSNVRPSGIAGQPVRLQTVVQPAGVRPVQNRLQVNPPGKQASANTLSNAPVVIKLEDEEDEIRILGERLSEPPVTMDYIHGELSVKKTSQGWKYAVKASNGKDIILTDEQIEERLKANNGVMK